MSTVVKNREYQAADIKLIHEALVTYQFVMYQLPTGGGKSVISSQVVEDYSDKNVLVLAHRKELIDQMEGHLQNRNLVPGKIQASNISNLDSNVIVASIRSVIKDKYLALLEEKSFDLLVIDEAHHAASASYQKIIALCLEHNPDCKVLGITATPWRKDSKGLDETFKHLIVSSEDTQSLINKGFLSDYNVFFTPVANIEGEVISYHSEYQMASLSAYMRKPEMINFAIESYKTNGQDKQMIVFCCDKAHAKDVNEAYIKAGYTKIAHIDSDTSPTDRDFIVEQFKNKNIQIITCIETLTEGFDVPGIGVVQLLRPTRSLTLYMQMIGRGLRLKEDGSNLIVLDCAGCTAKYGTPSRKRNWSLDPSVDPSKVEGAEKTIIVGKTKDGKFTRKEEEMVLGEIVEISEEDFLMQSANAIDDAKALNRELDEDTKERVKEFAQQLVDLMDNPEEWWVKPNDFHIDQFDIRHKEERSKWFAFEFKELTSKRWEGYQRVLTFKIQQSWASSDSSVESFEASIFFYGQAAKIARILKNTLKKQLSELIVNIRHNTESQVDVQKLQDRIDKFAEAQLERLADEYFKKNDSIKLPRAIYADSYTKSDGKISIIRLFTDGVKHTGRVQLLGRRFGWDEKDLGIDDHTGLDVVADVKYMKREKVLEMLKDGEAVLT